jgi:hypothetical protein
MDRHARPRRGCRPPGRRVGRADLRPRCRARRARRRCRSRRRRPAAVGVRHRRARHRQDRAHRRIPQEASG